MLKPRLTRLLLEGAGSPLLSRPSTCVSCIRLYNKQYLQHASTKAAAPKTPKLPPTKAKASKLPPPTIPHTDTANNEAGSADDHNPKPLDKPLGLPYAPEAGQNTGIDPRSLRERRDDFVDFDKHLQRRKQMTQQIAKPYFREWTAMRYHKGKSFLSNQKLFRAEKALYFPNMYGYTLSDTKTTVDTTPRIAGKVTLVSVWSSLWAENQAKTFITPAANPELEGILAENSDVAQRAVMHLEDNSAKAFLLRLFKGNMKRQTPQNVWERYFVVRKGLTDEIKDAIGLLNGQVGYTYLLDSSCRIRWAASGNAAEGEIEGLNSGLRRLVEEAKMSQASVQRKKTG